MTGPDARPDGPYDYYADLYGGGANVTADSIRGLVDEPTKDAATIALLADDLDHDATVTGTLVEGQIRSAVKHAPAAAAVRARQLSTNATYAVGLVNLMAAHVHTFDTSVAALNRTYQESQRACVVQPGAVDDPASAREYRRARHLLDDGAEEVARMFRQGATHANLRYLVDAGAIPLTTAGTWPWLHLSEDEMRKALLALVASGAVPDLATLPGGSVQSWLKDHPEIADYLWLFAPVPAPPSGGAVSVADWWRGLGVLGQLAAATRTPALVGNLDGVQGWGRDLANRTTLDALLAQIDAGHVPPGMAPDAVAALKAIRDDLGKLGERQLLGLDPYSGERTHAIVAIGNVDTADNVGVFTPGLTSNVPDSLNGYDADMDNLKQTAEGLILKHGGTGTVATVTYLGYDAPQLDASLLDLGAFGGQADSVLSSDLARKGGDSLAGFYQGLNASRTDPFQLTALGHSYGSTTTGYALQHDGVGVDNAVLFGSPGPGTGDRGQLHAGNLYVIENDDDLVADGGIFGGDPSFLDGTTQLQSHAADHDGQSYQGSTGHTTYLDKGTTAQHNLAAVLAGIQDEQVTGQDLDAGDLLTAPDPGDLLHAAGAVGGKIKDGFVDDVTGFVHGLESFGRPPGF